MIFILKQSVRPEFPKPNFKLITSMKFIILNIAPLSHLLVVLLNVITFPANYEMVKYLENCGVRITFFIETLNRAN